MERRVVEFGVLPLDRPIGRREAGHAQRPEMDEDCLALHDGGWAGMTVFGVDRRCLLDGADFPVPENFSGGRVERERPQRKPFANGNGGRQIDPARNDRGGRPPQPGDGRFPGDMLRFRPFQRSRLFGGMTIGIGATKLRPVAGEQGGDEKQRGRHGQARDGGK